MACIKKRPSAFQASFSFVLFFFATNITWLLSLLQDPPSDQTGGSRWASVQATSCRSRSFSLICCWCPFGLSLVASWRGNRERERERARRAHQV
ncbi:hypothetical protein B0T22DRAFT_453819 [Podospora appendiculata]|uniref:Uncharacterized protein n=1 Tax=Podospora appendiculata TaxID=314037 RepID=A0AAE0XKC6_9PEZI|nr:hypothetical protein B0T22DRAFT_453819 [Podospora appendiculata]